ncbi:MAG: hypothetical protein WBQ73_02430, partial [Candidatus Babeliales bacterium]
MKQTYTLPLLLNIFLFIAPLAASVRIQANNHTLVPLRQPSPSSTGWTNVTNWINFDSVRKQTVNALGATFNVCQEHPLATTTAILATIGLSSLVHYKQRNARYVEAKNNEQLINKELDKLTSADSVSVVKSSSNQTISGAAQGVAIVVNDYIKKYEDFLKQDATLDINLNLSTSTFKKDYTFDEEKNIEQLVRIVKDQRYNLNKSEILSGCLGFPVVLWWWLFPKTYPLDIKCQLVLHTNEDFSFERFRHFLFSAYIDKMLNQSFSNESSLRQGKTVSNIFQEQCKARNEFEKRIFMQQQNISFLQRINYALSQSTLNHNTKKFNPIKYGAQKPESIYWKTRPTGLAIIFKYLIAPNLKNLPKTYTVVSCECTNDKEFTFLVKSSDDNISYIFSKEDLQQIVSKINDDNIKGELERAILDMPKSRNTTLHNTISSALHPSREKAFLRQPLSLKNTNNHQQLITKLKVQLPKTETLPSNQPSINTPPKNDGSEKNNSKFSNDNKNNGLDVNGNFHNNTLSNLNIPTSNGSNPAPFTEPSSSKRGSSPAFTKASYLSLNRLRETIVIPILDSKLKNNWGNYQIQNILFKEKKIKDFLKEKKTFEDSEPKFIFTLYNTNTNETQEWFFTLKELENVAKNIDNKTEQKKLLNELGALYEKYYAIKKLYVSFNAIFEKQKISNKDTNSNKDTRRFQQLNKYTANIRYRRRENSNHNLILQHLIPLQNPSPFDNEGMIYAIQKKNDDNYVVWIQSLTDNKKTYTRTITQEAFLKNARILKKSNLDKFNKAEQLLTNITELEICHPLLTWKKLKNIRKEKNDQSNELLGLLKQVSKENEKNKSTKKLLSQEAKKKINESIRKLQEEAQKNRKLQVEAQKNFDGLELRNATISTGLDHPIAAPVQNKAIATNSSEKTLHHDL